MPLILEGKEKSYIKEKVDEMLEFVGLGDKGSQYPNELSGGQKQRVAIARALVTDPKILLCDEATSALDPATTDSILRLLKKVNRTFDVTILLITHEMGVIQQICDKVAVMEQGSVIEIGSVLEVFSHPKTKTAKSFVSTVISTDISDKMIHQLPTDADYVDVKVYLEGSQIGVSVIQTLIKDFNLDVNVIYASMSDIQDTSVGYLTLRIKGSNESKQRAFDYMKQSHIEFEEVV